MHRAIHQSYLRLKEAGRLQNNSYFNDEVWLKIGSDKGGNSTKLVFEIANSVAPNSVRNTELINIFEATDSFDNIHKMFLPFAEQISNLNILSFSENEENFCLVTTIFYVTSLVTRGLVLPFHVFIV